MYSLQLMAKQRTAMYKTMKLHTVIRISTALNVNNMEYLATREQSTHIIW